MSLTNIFQASGCNLADQSHKKKSHEKAYRDGIPIKQPKKVRKKMSKDIEMGVRKGTVVLFVPTLFGFFWGIPSLYAFSFFSNVFWDLFQFFFCGVEI